MHRSIVAAAVASASLLVPYDGACAIQRASSSSGPTVPAAGPGLRPAAVAPPPPQNAVAGDGQYVAPMQQQTQQTYVPQSVAMSGPRVLRDWHEGEPIPPGYHPATRARTRPDRRRPHDVRRSVPHLRARRARSARTRNGYACTTRYFNSIRQMRHRSRPRIVGPFITWTQRRLAVADVFLVVDGLLQAAGIGMFIYGVAVPKTVLVRNDLGKVKINPPMPFVGKNCARPRPVRHVLRTALTQVARAKALADSLHRDRVLVADTCAAHVRSRWTSSGRISTTRRSRARTFARATGTSTCRASRGRTSRSSSSRAVQLDRGRLARLLFDRGRLLLGDGRDRSDELARRAGEHDGRRVGVLDRRGRRRRRRYKKKFPVAVSFDDDGGPFGAAHQITVLPYQGVPLRARRVTRR